MFCGAEGIRTLILFLAKEALSQLSYNPNCFPPEIRTPIQWLKTTCPAIRREENIVAISRLELPTGSYPNLAHETSAAPALQYSCGSGNRTHLVQAYETRQCTSSSFPQYLILMKDSNLRLSAQRAPTYHLSNEKTVTHFHRQITNAYQTPCITLDPVAARSVSYPGFCSPYENRTRVSRLKT